jgi:hypothetical protein
MSNITTAYLLHLEFFDLPYGMKPLRLRDRKWVYSTLDRQEADKLYDIFLLAPHERTPQENELACDLIRDAGTPFKKGETIICGSISLIEWKCRDGDIDDLKKFSQSHRNCGGDIETTTEQLIRAHSRLWNSATSAADSLYTRKLRLGAWESLIPEIASSESTLRVTTGTARVLAKADHIDNSWDDRLINTYVCDASSGSHYLTQEQVIR